MTNSDFLPADPQFASFAETAVSAEKILNIDPSACVLNCRSKTECSFEAICFMGKSGRENTILLCGEVVELPLTTIKLTTD